MGRHEDDSDREVKKEKKEKKHKQKEKEKSRDKDRVKNRHKDSERHADDGRARGDRGPSPNGDDGAAKILDLHDAAEQEQSTIDTNGGVQRGSPPRREDNERRAHKSSRADPSRRDRDREADRDRRRDRSRDRHSDRDREHDRDRDRRRHGSKEVERERVSSMPREVFRPLASAVEEPEDKQKGLTRQPTPPMSSSAREASAREAERPAVQESGGEVSMSIEETNKVRISLGLKPLSTENESDKQRKAQQEREAQKAEEDKAAKAAALAERVNAQREKRLQDEKLRKIKTLGEAADDVDDVSAWINKSRALEEKTKAEARAKALKAAQALEEQDEELLDSDDEEGERLNNAKELAGMRVRHDADELGEGETMILTLADRNILDEHGDVDEDKDELENALVIEQKKRDKAKRAASKEEQVKPLFGEDGKRRTMLDKYDEEEDTGMEIDDSGAFSSEKAKQQAEIMAKLAAGDSAASAGVQPSYDGKSEYYTQDEMAAMFKPKKKKKKKALRKREEEPVDLSFLEAEAASAAADISADHGSRAQRGAVAEAQLAKREQDAADKQARYDNALEKANYASLALKQEQEQGAAQAEEDAEDDEELQATLARARRAALNKAQKQEADEEKPSLDMIAEEAARQREAAARNAVNSEGVEVLTEMAEYVKGVGRSGDDTSAQPKFESSHMGVDDMDEAPPQEAAEPKQEAVDGGKFGAWVAAGGDDGAADGDAHMGEAEEDGKEEDEPLHEKAIGRGIGAALELLKDRGDLKAPLQWAGRTNDINEAQRLRNEGQLTDVYTGGRQDNYHAAAIERALTQRDEFGNIMTPKERFRNLCYSFHGKDPSKNKKDKRFRKIQEEQERKRRNTGDDLAVSRLAAVQEQTATPYLVLSGKVKPGQSSDPASEYATVEKGAFSVAPSLGGGDTPLTGTRKVEAMLGIKRPAINGNTSMAPPPARKPKAG